MIIMKFGGTSVKDFTAINNLLRILKTRLSRKPVVVCSAVSGITDILLNLGIQASKGNIDESNRLLESIRRRHIQIIEESFLIDCAEKQHSMGNVNDLIKKLSDFIKGIYLLSELSDRSIAKILSFGEILSTTIIADILNCNSVKT